jgi:transcriptional regulator with XRE-family HTH domain
MESNQNGHTVRMLLSKNLKRLRCQKKVSQLNLAIHTGLTQNFINDIENGKKWVSPDTIAKLAIALNAEPHQLFIPNPTLEEVDKQALAGYLDEFAESVKMMVQELKIRYLQDDDKSFF